MNHGIMRAETLALVSECVKTPNLVRHMQAAEAIMRSLARKLGEDEIQ